MNLTSIAVFCGSQKGSDPVFVQHATELGEYMGRNNITLIYGGGKKGLMGAVADAAMKSGGKVTGIIPEILIGWEHQHTAITDLQVVADMHARKKIMYDLCDAAIILPGGNGTLDEMFEMLTWNTLKIHNKKIILLNSAGFYNHLISHIAHMQACDFLYEDWHDRILVVETAQQLISFLDEDKS
ncbi:TIGR00730 family Rossman fold protein [Segetibacter aerophilus]|uniref:Cytokinin riboside 5'-monophosphate phosphoribohydrolase n=1 Tax=Segetibacter aerophilus TaxID=670293 RepID=A0A512BC81_9BACT|nr:TIGR00730 family Rossman fold protein [Segetibacter aerophilus]GEO09524.1 cytokinin riboside 5'-monophosphate phosphoribohydrolase [Segetibacter aerophilus]